MNGTEKSHAESASTSFSVLPEDIVLQILNKLIDLKTLCLCKLVSRQFNRIVHQVDTISLTYFTDPLVDTSNLRPYGSAIGSLMLFDKVKSLCIIFPSSFDNDSLYKWKLNFNIRLITFIYLSPNSLYRNKELYVSDNGHEEEDMELIWKNASQCLKDAVKRFKMLVHHVLSLPLLEKVAITDSGKRGKVSLSGGKVAEVRNWLPSPYGETIEQKMKFLQTGCRASKCYVPLLELPVSGYMMKGVSLFLAEWNDLANDNYDSFMKNSDAFEDKEETVYFEAMMEILKKHSGRIERKFSSENGKWRSSASEWKRQDSGQEKNR